MNEFNREKKKIEGMISLAWLSISAILFLIALIAWMIWKTKIAIFFLAVGTLLLLVCILIFMLWEKSLRK
ncbi:hypothetical protein [Pediococcus claussenii]|uniref:hypothetical protein n=1 Tax=Pediococcus claussenii TaxID=187452 RepID=UPI00081A7CA4|nr:hypothetical protein [Pediococcus claussenii]ANZ70342.1 hypothetical protein AYR57_08450 [Pediococcus claussenii]ANZ72158.1 hypothetical protein AYR58_08450 [Pediococcus claussenii]